MDTDLLIATARTWLGTPFHHQGRRKGAGCDCLGMFVGIARELQLYSRITIPDKSRIPLAAFDNTRYSVHPNTDKLVAELGRHLQEVELDALQVGDLVLMNVLDNPQHIGILTQYPQGGFGLLHALSGQGVVEQRLDEHWHNRISHAYRLTQENYIS